MHELVCIASLVTALCAWPAPVAFAPEAPRDAHDAHHAHGAHGAQQPVPVQATDAWLGSDKFRHFGLSWAVTAYGFAAARAAGMERDAALQVAVPVAAAAGIGKEIYDLRRGGPFSMRDLAADALGIVTAFFLLREVR